MTCKTFSNLLGHKKRKQGTTIVRTPCFNAAIERGYFNLGLYLVSRSCYFQLPVEKDDEMSHRFFDQRSAFFAIATNRTDEEAQIQLLQKLLLPCSPLMNSSCAAFRGNLNVLQWMKNNDALLLDESICNYAAEGGHLSVIQWLRGNQCPWDAETCHSAAANGHLELLQWAQKNGCPWSAETSLSAAEGGHLNVLKWAHENGCPWDEDTCTAAAEGGHFELLKWAHENGCPWDTWTCAYAAKQGNLEMLQWLRTKGCPWDSQTCTFAASEGHLHVLNWARQNGCPINLLACTEGVLDSSSRLDREIKSILNWLIDECPENLRFCIQSRALQSPTLEECIFGICSHFDQNPKRQKKL